MENKKNESENSEMLKTSIKATFKGKTKEEKKNGLIGILCYTSLKIIEHLEKKVSNR